MKVLVTERQRGIIYGLFDPRTAEIRYIGKTRHWPQRPAGHKNNIHGKSRMSQWMRDLLDYGESYSAIALEEGYWTRLELNRREKWWIALYRAYGTDLLNETAGGDGGSSEGALRRWMSDDERRRASERALARFASPSEREIVSAGVTAAWATEETRKRHREAYERQPLFRCECGKISRNAGGRISHSRATGHTWTEIAE